MAKRRRSPLSDDQDWSEGDTSHALTDSELEDASFGKHPNSSSSRKKVMTRKGAKVPKIDASSISNAEISSHTRSSHVISQARSMRTALLRWYETVHTTRGMPWRKPYNPSLGQDERAQRAYEVRVVLVILLTFLTMVFLAGLDFRNYVTANTSCHSHSLLQSLDGEVVH